MWNIVILVFCVFMVAFFSSTETAFMSLSDLKIRHLVNKDVKNAKTVALLRKDTHRLLILILVGNTLVMIAASAIATDMAIKSFGSYGVGIATGIMTFVLLVFGEITPKAYCAKNSEKIALAFAPVVMFLSKLFFPLVEMFHLLTHLMTNRSARSKGPLVTEDELRTIINIGEEEGSIKYEEKEMIQNVFRFDDIPVGNIMLPRIKLFALEENKTVSEIRSIVGEEAFSRIPLYHKNLDNIKGILFTKDLLRAKPDDKLKDLARPAFFVPETKKINVLFKEMNKQKSHIAIVVDEHGSVTGIVTIEDLIEEVLGEIYDETDEIKDFIVKFDDNTYIVDADLEIKRLNKKLRVLVPGNINRSISAFILEKIGKIPSKGEKISIPGIDFTVEEVQNHKIQKVKIELVQAVSASEQAKKDTVPEKGKTPRVRKKRISSKKRRRS